MTGAVRRLRRVSAAARRAVSGWRPGTRDSTWHRNAVRGVALALEEFGIQPYQPLYGVPGSREGHGLERDVTDRWELMAGELPTTGSALDVGCQYGWFAFKLAERGLDVIGIDDQPRTIAVARSISVASGLDAIGFWCRRIEPGNAATLPDVGTMLLMSVFHHWARENGQQYAESLLADVVSHCRSQLVFETGGPTEEEHDWSRSLEFMLPDPDAYIEALLRANGFGMVRRLGSTPGYRRKGRRTLFLATRDQSG